MATIERRRNSDEEELEKQRYALLEQVYLLAGSGGCRRVNPEELRAQLEASPDANRRAYEDLIRLGYVEASEDGTLAMTHRAVEFLQRDAWRRRTIRE